MKKFKILIFSLIQIIFFLTTINTINAKNISKFQSGDKISKYFSGIVSFNDNAYANSYIFLKGLNGLEDRHLNYSKLYQYSLINLERFPEAYRYAKSLEKKELDSFESNLIIGTFYLKNKKYEKALQHFKKIKKSNQPQTLEGLLSESLYNWISFLQINENQALKLTSNIHPRFENIKSIQKTFLYCFYDSNKTNREFTNLASNPDTNFARYNFFHSNYLFNSGKKKQAIKLLDKSLRAYPTNLILNQLKADITLDDRSNFSNKFNCKDLSHVIAELFYVISNAFSGQSFYSYSNFYLNLAKYLNPEFTSFNALYAENLNFNQNYKKAKKIFKEIKKNGKFYNWYAAKQISNILIIQNKNDQALTNLTEAFKILVEPNAHQIYDYAEFLKNQEKYEDSVKYYSKVLNMINKKNDLYPKVTDGRGISYERLGQWEKAEKDLLNSLNAKPDQAYVINYLAYSWIEKGINIEKSLQMLKRANELKKNDGYIIDSLGWALYKLKRYDEAKGYLQLAVMIMPSDPIINDHFADTLWENGNKIQARYYWNYVLGLKKTEKKLKKIIEKKLIFGVE